MSLGGSVAPLRRSHLTSWFDIEIFSKVIFCAIADPARPTILNLTQKDKAMISLNSYFEHLVILLFDSFRQKCT